MSDLSMLNSTIKALNARCNDLRKMSSQDLPDDEISEILDQIKLINADKYQFEELRDHLQASQITVAEPSEDDTAAISAALDVLNEPIAADQKWSAGYTAARAILDAANEIEGNFRKRQR